MIQVNNLHKTFGTTAALRDRTRETVGLSGRIDDGQLAQRKNGRWTSRVPPSVNPRSVR